ncbi:origin recognition complex subunit 6-domain-containing protein [Chaetomium tenue]|uniref:Origin recognition complex subunit 6-domain-containing protein n=1 Tax=Chaetomium tenue TaxID=1854479 RepID=A0ACB7NU64_9PEZI|nr:origin recognition complex subunit 6-domain-containing protein [Chaetomium globosum]
MNRSIEQTLLSLLPTHNSDLPEPLTQLASSLLAQSRNRASILKAEEEVARLYACANLACDRLKISLNLPPIDPRPPIPPRIYKRLYNHLDKILPPTASTPSRRTPGETALGSGRTRTPTSKLRAQQQQQHDHNTSPLANKSRTPTTTTTTTTTTTATTPITRKEKHPPQKEKSLADLRNHNQPHKPTPSRSQKDPLPPWIRPTLRHLLTTLGPSHIGPVVASAVESVLAPRGKPTTDAWARANAAAVLGALYLFVWRGVVWPAGEGVERERYVGMRRGVAGGIGGVRDQGVVEIEGGDDDGVWEGWKAVGVAELDAAAVRGRRHGWFEMGWVSGVQDLVDREAARVEEEEEEEAGRGGGGDGDGDGEVVQIRRADTMFQERYDYLGDRKRKAYAEWKEGVLKKIKELEAR